MTVEPEIFGFRFAPAYRLAALPFGITPRFARVAVGDGRLDIRFGPWRLVTGLDNVVGAEVVSGPYAFLKTAGPAHLSLADRGITFATHNRGGVCIRFRVPVPALDPFGLVRHPGVTVTVARPGPLVDRLT